MTTTWFTHDLTTSFDFGQVLKSVLINFKQYYQKKVRLNYIKRQVSMYSTWFTQTLALIKLKKRSSYYCENIAPLKKIVLDKIKVIKANDEIFKLSSGKKPLRIKLDRAYGETNMGLCNDEFIKIANWPAFDMIIKRIRTEVNKIDRTNDIFVSLAKIKVLNNERLHLK